LTQAGFAAVRRLAEHEGQVFVEGIKRRFMVNRDREP
jgi:hypothetical protein